MNSLLVSGVAMLAASAVPAVMVSSSAAACTPHVIHSKTIYPLSSQLRGQKGTVHVAVTITADGYAQSAQLHRSSGYLLLDRAATRSILRNWLFDVGTCERAHFPAAHLVAIEYRNDVY